MARKRRLTPQQNIGERGLTVTGKSPSFASSLIVRPGRGGQVLVAQLPNKKPPPATAAVRDVWAWLRASALLWSLTDTRIRAQYIEQSKGLWLQPRDIFTAALAGRLFSLDYQDDDRLRFVATRRMIRDMSTSLDMFGYVAGTMLYRDLDRWRGLAPGSPGQYLRLNQFGTPEWATHQATGGGRSLVLFSGAAELSATGQGAAIEAFGDGWRTIRLLGYQNSGVELVGLLPLDAVDFVPVATVGCSAADGGVQLWRWRWRRVSLSGAILASGSQDFSALGWSAGEIRSFTGESVALPALVDATVLWLRLERLGGDSGDTSSQNSSLLWLGATA